ncbi:hypothetical protein C1Y11_24715 [Pseudomonas sp. FW305-20]|nr:hypothetical protein C1Y11_24715 [Pseudomonas sp. FW305-20]PMU15251.1 hypothetical protein C1Y10_22955 [Pseudomonas sp. FW305-122]PMU36900.1 hypothetical protein C1Y12_20880 [Pseudomonas sp. FW305-47B]PMX57270.1 hypothetical protein C1Y13_24935 [Pseudomonas sp. FW305-33]PMX69200.1 hypothetical protein C1X12_08420 [Pseudomonas sp. FW305-60]
MHWGGCWVGFPSCRTSSKPAVTGRLEDDQCGSEPARDGGISVDICVVCQSAIIASWLAPTGFCDET